MARNTRQRRRQKRRAQAGGGDGTDQKQQQSVSKRARTRQQAVRPAAQPPKTQTGSRRVPGGGFRRFVVAGDGTGVAAADGAEPAMVTIIDDDRIEVAIGGDTFRLPATVQAR